MNAANSSPWTRALAACGAGLVLVLCVLSACPEAHHWLHHDSCDEGHECAVTVFAHGATPASVAVFLVPVTWVATPDFFSSAVEAPCAAPAHSLPFGQAPPAE